jgi:predicted DNA-binding protein with PD1-like motif
MSVIDTEKFDKMEATTNYSVICGGRGREFILSLGPRADVVKTLKKFGKEHNIGVAKIHAFNRGSLYPTRLEIWTPDTTVHPTDREKSPTVFTESYAHISNPAMGLALNGIMFKHPKEDEHRVLAHVIVGASWDVPTIGGHLLEGSLCTGGIEVIVTEITGVEVAEERTGYSFFKPAKK